MIERVNLAVIDRPNVRHAAPDAGRVGARSSSDLHHSTRSGAIMSNVRPVDAVTQTRVLADFFTLGHTANVPAVDAVNLRQALPPNTPDGRTRSGEGER